jgi:hypothetical protein
VLFEACGFRATSLRRRTRGGMFTHVLCRRAELRPP